MAEDAVVAIVDLVALLAQPETEIDVLVAVDKPGVEAADVLEEVTTNERARAGDDLEPT